MGERPGTVDVPIDGLTDPVITVDERWRIVDSNAAGRNLLGGDRREYLGSRVEDRLQFRDPSTAEEVQPADDGPPEPGGKLDRSDRIVIERDGRPVSTVTITVVPTAGDGAAAAMLLFRTVDTEGDRQRRRQRQREALYELSIDDAITGGEFEAAIESITETAADVLRTTRVGVWLFDESRDRMRCIDRYDRRSGRHTRGDELIADRYPAYFEAIRTGRTVDIPDARTDPRTEAMTEAYLEPNDIRSTLDATLRDGGEVVGVVCHEQVGRAREWTADEIGFAGNVADIVHRTLRSQERARNRRRLEFRRSLLKAQQESVRDGILVVDTTGAFVSYNERFRELWGIPEEIFERGNEADALAYARDALEEPEPFFELIERLRADSTETSHDEVRLESGRLLDVYSGPVVDGDGTHYGRLWRCRDITDRRERQRELELKNRAIDEAPIGICITDPEQDDNPLVYVNEAFERITGYPADEAIGRNCRFLQGEQTDPGQVARIRDAIDAERPVEAELRNYRKDGSPFWNRLTIAPIADEDGEVRNFLGFQQDVSDRVETNRQLRVLDRVLRHNITNGMNVIRGYAAEIDVETEGDRVAVETVIDESERLIGLTEKHRSIVRLLSDPPQPQSIPLWELLRSIAVQVRGIDAETELSIDGSTEAVVRAIPTVEQAFEELLSNAVAYGGCDSPAIDIDVSAGEETVSVRIRDYGTGLPEEEATILTGDQHVDPLTHGLGLGLWHVYWIVSLSGGSIDVEWPDPGTAITIELPRESRSD